MTGAIAGDGSCDVGAAMLFTWDLWSWCGQCRITDFRRKEGSSTFMFLILPALSEFMLSDIYVMFCAYSAIYFLLAVGLLSNALSLAACLNFVFDSSSHSCKYCSTFFTLDHRTWSLFTSAW